VDETERKKDPGEVSLSGEERLGACDSTVPEEQTQSPAENHVCQSIAVSYEQHSAVGVRGWRWVC